MATSMPTKKEHTTEATLLVADQIKKATFNAAKGLSRFQAERVAAAAARNVNAYGQKEEGPSRWQERKEAKRQMYLMSTEKAVKLGVRKDNKTMTDFLGGGVRCQRCFGAGHWTFECKNERVYVSRPSQTQKLQNPTLRQPLLDLCDRLPTSKREVEVDVKQNYTSYVFATLEENKGSKSNRSPPRKSDLRNRKRRRSKSTSSDTSSTEDSPSKSDSDTEEESPSSSEDPTSTTHSSSTFSSPSRTSSSSRKSSSCSSTDPPTPESESEDKPSNTTTILTQSNFPAKGEPIDLGDTQSECQLQSLTTLSICKFDNQKSKRKNSPE